MKGPHVCKSDAIFPISRRLDTICWTPSLLALLPDFQIRKGKVKTQICHVGKVQSFSNLGIFGPVSILNQHYQIPTSFQYWFFLHLLHFFPILPNWFSYIFADFTKLIFLLFCRFYRTDFLTFLQIHERSCPWTLRFMWNQAPHSVLNAGIILREKKYSQFHWLT